MRYFIDTEFVEDGRTIDLISIGVVAEDGREFYAHSGEYDRAKAEAHPFVSVSVLPHLVDTPAQSRESIRDELAVFLRQGGDPELWGYFAAWDHIALMQLWGDFSAQPDWLPMRSNDVAQLAQMMGVRKLPHQSGSEHDALADARWTKEVFDYLAEVSFARSRA